MNSLAKQCCSGGRVIRKLSMLELEITIRTYLSVLLGKKESLNKIKLGKLL